MSWYRYDQDTRRLTLILYIQPNARVTAVAGLHGDALKVKVAAPPLEDRANRELIDFLHQWFKLRILDITVKQGARSRRKIVELRNAGPAVMAILISTNDAICQTDSKNA